MCDLVESLHALTDGGHAADHDKGMQWDAEYALTLVGCFTMASCMLRQTLNSFVNKSGSGHGLDLVSKGRKAIVLFCLCTITSHAALVYSLALWEYLHL